MRPLRCTLPLFPLHTLFALSNLFFKHKVLYQDKEEVGYLSQRNRDDLYNISNQMIDIFIKDIFAKNGTDLEKAKTNISDEQKETLKNSVHQLKGQVESFIHDQNASKTVTENNNETTNKTSTNPLKEKILANKQEVGELDEVTTEED